MFFRLGPGSVCGVPASYLSFAKHTMSTPRRKKRSVVDMLTEAPLSATQQAPRKTGTTKRVNRKSLFSSATTSSTEGVDFGRDEVLIASESNAIYAKRKKVAEINEKGNKYHIQTAIHAAVDFRREGESAKTEESSLLEVYTFLKAECSLPTDLQNNTQKYGPLSGVSYEERAISAYVHGLLSPSCLSSVAAQLRVELRKCFIESDMKAAAMIVRAYGN